MYGRTDDAFRRPLTRPIVDTIDDEDELRGKCVCKNVSQKSFMCLLIAILLCTSVTFAALWRVEVGKVANTLDSRDEVPDVRRALIDLYFSTNSNRTWSGCDANTCNEARCQGKVRWVSQEHYCTWKCVTCDANQVVTGLFLAHNHMSGTVPASLTWISSLQTLDVSQNAHLAGTLPASLGGSAALQTLAFNSTQISGTLPAALSRADKRAPPSRPTSTQHTSLLGFRVWVEPRPVSLALASPLAGWRVRPLVPSMPPRTPPVLPYPPCPSSTPDLPTAPTAPTAPHLPTSPPPHLVRSLRSVMAMGARLSGTIPAMASLRTLMLQRQLGSRISGTLPASRCPPPPLCYLVITPQVEQVPLAASMLSGYHTPGGAGALAASYLWPQRPSPTAASVVAPTPYAPSQVAPRGIPPGQQSPLGHSTRQHQHHHRRPRRQRLHRRPAHLVHRRRARA